MITFSDTGIEDPRLTFDGGVAAIDLMTLRRCAQKGVDLGFPLQLPEAADVEVPPIFDDLCVVEADTDSGRLIVKAMIDTAKMTWAFDSDVYVRAESFTDYSGATTYGVRLEDPFAASIDGVVVSFAPMKLRDGRPLRLWFADMPQSRLDTMGFRELFAWAESLSRRFQPRQRLDWIIVPAQQIAYERRLVELLPVNQPQLEDAGQRFAMTLDETGVRVRVESRVCLAAAFGPNLNHTFGADDPVVMWLTAEGSSVPFAVIATTAEAWLRPGHQVAFGGGHGAV